MKELGRLFRTYCYKKQTSWACYVADIAECHNAIPHSSTGFAPCELVTGKKPTQLLTDLLKKYLPDTPEEELQTIRDKAYVRLQAEGERRRKRIPDNRTTQFHIGDLVLLKSNPVSKLSEKINQKLCLLYDGPFEIIDNPHPNAYTLKNVKTNEIRGVFNTTNIKRYVRDCNRKYSGNNGRERRARLTAWRKTATVLSHDRALTPEGCHDKLLIAVRLNS